MFNELFEAMVLMEAGRRIFDDLMNTRTSLKAFQRQDIFLSNNKPELCHKMYPSMQYIKEIPGHWKQRKIAVRTKLYDPKYRSYT